MEAPTKISPFRSPQTFQDPHFKRKKTTSSQTFLSNFFGNFFVEKNKKQPRKTSISQRDSAILLGITFFLCGSITHSCRKLLSERESFRSSLTPSFRDPQGLSKKIQKKRSSANLIPFPKTHIFRGVFWIILRFQRVSLPDSISCNFLWRRFSWPINSLVVRMVSFCFFLPREWVKEASFPAAERAARNV